MFLHSHLPLILAHIFAIISQRDPRSVTASFIQKFWWLQTNGWSSSPEVAYLSRNMCDDLYVRSYSHYNNITTKNLVLSWKNLGNC